MPNDTRFHIILVPGFGGFDALGNVKYYSGVTELFHGAGLHGAVLHYFDNLPTAAVETRAIRLGEYIAKRMARGEISRTDKLVLVGHSTAGLDIRQLIWNLHDPKHRFLRADGGVNVPARDIRNCLDGVVFLSVPHWGTNVADWVHSHRALRETFIAYLRGVVAGSQMRAMDQIEAEIARYAASYTESDLFLVLKDALTEANDGYGDESATRLAEAQEAASNLDLYLHHMSSDFSIIDDLTSECHHARETSPAHFSEERREEEFALWAKDPPIRVLSYATVAGRVFDFTRGRSAPEFKFTSPLTYPVVAWNPALSTETDFLYRFCYRACAGGPLRWPAKAGKIGRLLGPAPPLPIELWDNDGIVNTASMLWPEGEVVLVMADHLDVVGHYKRVFANGTPSANGRRPARVYQTYDSFKSVPQFGDRQFAELWSEVFAFAVNATPRSVKRGKGAAAGKR